jgi:hypothetical protein
MRAVLLAWLIVMDWSCVAGVENAGQEDPSQINLLLDAIARVESHDVTWAAGDGGRAFGAYQIHRAYWADGTRFLGVDWDYGQAADPAKAREVVKAYLLHYGRGCSLLEMARIHNGGPNGHRKPSTLNYARRIEQIVENGRPQGPLVTISPERFAARHL